MNISDLTSLQFITSTTFEVVTEESAEHGECESTGFVEEDVTRDHDELVDHLWHNGFREPSDSIPGPRTWLTTSVIEDRAYFEKGEHQRHSIHLRRVLDKDGNELDEKLMGAAWVCILRDHLDRYSTRAKAANFGSDM